MTELHVLRVFCDPQGHHGNPLGVFLDGGAVPPDQRQAVAAELGFSETVFVDDPIHGAIRIFTPEIELPFAGHPTVGTAWLLREHKRKLLGGEPPRILRPPAGELAVRFSPSGSGEEVRTYVVTDPAASPPFALRQHGSAEEIDQLDAENEASGGWTYAWAWIDEQRSLVRARSFVSEAGILEDEATGSAAVLLAAELERAIEIRQGAGSVIEAAPAPTRGLIEFGGTSLIDEVREYELA